MAEVNRALLGTVDRAAPGLRVVRKWGMPWRVGRDLVLLTGAFRAHVGIGFWRGTSLPDPHHLLEGTGKNIRHVKIRSVQEAQSPKLAALVRAAAWLDRVETPRRR